MLKKMLGAARIFINRFGGVNDRSRTEYANWANNNDLLSGGEKAYRHIDEKGRVYQSVSLRAPEPRTDEKFFRPLIHPKTGKAFAVPPNGFSRTPETLAAMLVREEILFGEDESTQPRQKLVLKPDVEKQFSSVVQDARTGKQDVQPLGLDFPYCHPTSLYETLLRGAQTSGSITLDFFAGSATTGHAVININREDGGERKFLLVEQGEYFDTVTLPRIAKVMTAPEWKDGAPKDSVQHADHGDPDHWSRRTLPLVRVLRLERYEDSLNALDFSAVAAGPGDSGNLLAAGTDERLIRYWLQDESEGQPVRLSTERLADPFAYRLTLHEPGGAREVTVDLLETTRLLLGLVPRRWREATDAQGQRHQWLEASRCADVARGLVNPPPVLLWLRPVDDERGEAQAQAEYGWLKAQIPQHFAGRPLADFATVLHNRAAFWPAGCRAESIDGLLAQRMLERAR